MTPLPPADLAERELPIQLIESGMTLYRVHPADYGAVFFGPGSGKPPAYRFDDQLGEYGVCYLASTPLTAFVETFLRDLSTMVVSEANLSGRSVSRVGVLREIRVVRVHREGLYRIGGTSAVSGARPYEASQAWSRALHDHPDEPDGVAYHSSHDDTLECIALFGDRASDAIAVSGHPTLLADERALLAEAIRRYGIILLPDLSHGRSSG